MKSKKVLPNFLGIGVMRGGSTWLYELLSSHPEIYLPKHVKEIRFFERNYNKGLNWYKKFFPIRKESSNYKAIGEVTPKYIFDENIPKLVKKDLGNNMKFILILRNPVDRVFSHFQNSYLYGNTNSKNLFDFIKKNHDCIERGYYSKQLKNWFQYYSKDKFLILFFDDIIFTPEKEIKKIGDFLEVDYKKFNLNKDKVNSSYVPKFHFVFKIGSKINSFLVFNNLHILANIVQKIGNIFRKIDKGKKIKKLSFDKKKKIYEMYYKEEIQELEKLLGVDLSNWKY